MPSGSNRSSSLANTERHSMRTVDAVVLGGKMKSVSFYCGTQTSGKELGKTADREQESVAVRETPDRGRPLPGDLPRFEICGSCVRDLCCYQASFGSSKMWTCLESGGKLPIGDTIQINGTLERTIS